MTHIEYVCKLDMFYHRNVIFTMLLCQCKYEKMRKIMPTVYARSDDCPPYWKHIPKLRIRIPITLDPLKYIHSQIYTCIIRYNFSFRTVHKLHYPVRARGLSRECVPPYPQRDRKRRLNGAVCRNHRIKRLVPCRC